MSKTIFVFFLVFGFSCQAQYFNELYDFEGAGQAGLSVAETSNGYIQSAMVLNTAGRERAGYLIVDRNGVVLYKKSYSYGPYLVRNGQMIALRDGNILDFRTLQEVNTQGENVHTWLLLIKVNELGDVIWSKQIKDLSVTWLGAQSLIETSDSGFVLVADKKINNTNRNPVLIRINKIGNELFRKEIKTNKSEVLNSASIYPNGDFVFAGGGDSRGAEFRSWVVRTNDSLDVTWDYYGAYKSSFYSRALVLSDFTIIHTTDSALPAGDWSIKRLSKLDSNGKEVWGRNHEGSKKNAYYTKAVELKDRSLVAYGHHDIGGSSFRTLTKLTPEGDTIWSNLYYYISTADRNNLRDFIATKDGGFLLGGDVSPRSTSGGQDLWLLKVDSNGCSTPDCKSRVYDVRLGIDYREQANTEFKVFPNPVKNVLNIEQIDENSAKTNWTYRLISANGKELQMGRFNKEKILNTSYLPTGVYLLKLENGPIHKVYRVVKE